ncbi:MAG: hypothetical protein WCI73_04420 [Phycisphaerae bacterium]
MDQRPIIERQRQWWRRENTQVLVGHYFPVTVPYEGLDNDVAPQDIGWRKQANAEANMKAAETAGSDMLVVERVDFSVAMVPAIAGAGYARDQHTSWSVPVAEQIGDVRIKPFNRADPLWVQYEQRLEDLLKHWAWDSYLPSLADYLGPMDILAGMMGPENLALAMIEEPMEVQKRAMDAADFLVDMIAYEVGLHRSAGMRDGVTDGFEVWLEGTGVRGSEDFAALVGLDHFRQFFVEPLSRVYGSLNSCFLHTHSAAIQCFPGILEVHNLGAVELGNDPGGPGWERRVAAGRLVQAAGKPLQMGSWNVPLPREQMEAIVRGLDQRGLMVRFQAANAAEARELGAAVREWGASGRV